MRQSPSRDASALECQACLISILPSLLLAGCLVDLEEVLVAPWLLASQVAWQLSTQVKPEACLAMECLIMAFVVAFFAALFGAANIMDWDAAATVVAEYFEAVIMNLSLPLWCFCFWLISYNHSLNFVI